MKDLQQLQQNKVLNKLVSNIIATAVIEPDDISNILKNFFDSEKTEVFEDHILVDSCVIKINNCICIKASVSVNSNFFSLPSINLITNDINHYVEFEEEEVNCFMKKIDTIVDFIIKP